MRQLANVPGQRERLLLQVQKFLLQLLAHAIPTQPSLETAERDRDIRQPLAHAIIGGPLQCAPARCSAPRSTGQLVAEFHDGFLPARLRFGESGLQLPCARHARFASVGRRVRHSPRSVGENNDGRTDDARHGSAALSTSRWIGRVPTRSRSFPLGIAIAMRFRHGPHEQLARESVGVELTNRRRLDRCENGTSMLACASGRSNRWSGSSSYWNVSGQRSTQMRAIHGI